MGDSEWMREKISVHACMRGCVCVCVCVPSDSWYAGRHGTVVLMSLLIFLVWSVCDKTFVTPRSSVLIILLYHVVSFGNKVLL